MGLINIAIGINLLNGGIVIIACSFIAIINYFIFLREKKYIHILEMFFELSLPESKKKRIRTAFLALSIAGFLAITVAALNNQDFRDWLIR
jgi:hypothetical protein